MASFGSEIGVVALEHFTKDLFIAGNEQVVARFGVRNDLARQRSGQFEIGRAARKSGSCYRSGRNIEQTIGRAGTFEFDIDTFDEDFQGCFCGAVDRKERGTHETGNAHHHRTRKGGSCEQTPVESAHDANRRYAIHSKRTFDVGFVEFFEECEATETGRDEQSVGVSLHKAVEKGEITALEIETMH